MIGRKKKEAPWRGGVYLTTVSTSFEADLLESKLRACDIPVLKRYEGASNFLEITLGFNSAYPIELYVPEEALEEAREVIRPVPIEDDFVEAQEDAQDDGAHGVRREAEMRQEKKARGAQTETGGDDA